MGVAFSAELSNMAAPEQVEEVNGSFSPILGISLLTLIANLGTPPDYPQQ